MARVKRGEATVHSIDLPVAEEPIGAHHMMCNSPDPECGCSNFGKSCTRPPSMYAIRFCRNPNVEGGKYVFDRSLA